MPIYEYSCRCGKKIEKFHKVNRVPGKTRCSCGWLAKRVISIGAVKADSINEIKWLPSACQTLQRPGEKPIESRSEYNAYLKKKSIACVG
jgi:putative FmdB family regulatory protein